MKFFVCDDDKTFLSGFKNELLKTDSSLDVICFDNGKQMVEYLKTEHSNIDAAFIDIRLSGYARFLSVFLHHKTSPLPIGKRGRSFFFLRFSFMAGRAGFTVDS